MARATRLRLALRLAALLYAGSAAAHAPPEATGILWASNGAGERTVVRTNRGLIVSEDGGMTFGLLCNDAFGASLTEVAPVATTSAGRVLVATYLGGLFEASADLCDFTSVAGPLSKGTNVVGLEATNGTPRLLFAIASRDASADHLFTSTDDGATWHAPSHVGDFLFSLQVAPSDPKRLYATSLHDPDGGASIYRLLVSSDGGQTFGAHEVSLGSMEIGVSVLGVDPVTPDRAFARTAASDPTLAERLLRTDDGGATLVDVMTLRGPSNVVTSADGATVWVGGQDGLFRSTDHGKTFSALTAAGVIQVACLALHDGKLFACGLSGNAFGVFQSTDGGDSFSPYLRFPDVKAPLACSASSGAGMACATRFEDWRIEQGLALPDGGSTPGAGGAGSGGASQVVPPSSGGTSSGGAVNGGAANGGVPVSGAPSTAGTATSGASTSSGCRLGAGRGENGARAFTLNLAAFLVVARRMRRRSRR